MKIKDLIGSGDKIILFTLPFIIIGIGLNIIYPKWLTVGGPPVWLLILSIIVLIPGLIIWLWSVYLILAIVPKHKLITWGPYALIKHPIYSGFGILVLPWIGFLLNSWVGALVGGALYVATRLFGPEEEKLLSNEFKEEWTEYIDKVLVPWF